MSKVSIIIPVYGAEPYIEQCAKCLFAQTLGSLEYIFINDCTQDKSIDIVQRVLVDFPHRKDQVHILHNEKNLGQGKTRKRGILAAKGEFVIHCDPDDWVELDMYEKMYEKAVHTNSDIVMCDFFKNYPDGRESRMNMADDVEKKRALINFYTAKRMGTLCGHLVARKIVQDKEIAWPEWSYTEDLALMFQYVMKAERIATVGQALYHYRDNVQSISYKEQEILRIDSLQTNRLVEKWCRDLGIWQEMLSHRLARGFKSKNRVLGFEKGDDYAAQTAWLNEKNKYGFCALFKAAMPVKTKLYSIVLLLRLLPVVNKVVDIRHRIWS